MTTVKNQKLTFPGLHGEFLFDELDNYIEAVETGSIPDVVASIQRRFFKRFPLSLADDEDPSPEWLAQVDDNAAEPEIQLPNEDSMTADEYRAAMAAHNELMGRVEKKKEQIARRLAYMYKKHIGPVERAASVNDLMALFMSKLGAGNLKKPRQKIHYNVWASQNKSTVDAEFAKRSAGVPAVQHAQLRSSVYKELFKALPDIERQAVVQEVAAQHALALIEYERSLKTGPSTLPQDQQRAIECIPQLLEPILDLLAAHTGWKWTAIGGGPEPAKGGRLSMISVHSGLTSGMVKMNFGRSERRAFRTQIMPIFGEFMKKCWTVEECKACALPEGHTGTQVADICNGEKWLVAYGVDDSDEEDDFDDDAFNKRARHPSSRLTNNQADEQIRAREKAREAAKKFRIPSAASTSMASSLQIAAPASTLNPSTSTSKVGPPVCGKRAGKAQSKVLRQRPEKGRTGDPTTVIRPQVSTTVVPAPSNVHPTPHVALHQRPSNGVHPPSPFVSHPAPSPLVSRPPSPLVSRPPSPLVSRPLSPLVSRPPSPLVSRLPSPVVLDVQPPVVTCAHSPVVSGLQMPIVPRPSSPAVSRPPSPAVSRPLSPAISRPPSPAVSRPPSPAVSRPPSPAVSRLPSPAVSRPPPPAASHSLSPAASCPLSPVVSHPPSPAISCPPSLVIPRQTASVTSGPGTLPHTASALVSAQRIPSGAVAVPDVTIPNVGPVSLGLGLRKRKGTDANSGDGTNKRARASSVTHFSPQSANTSGTTWSISIPAKAPSWVEKAVMLFQRDDFGAQWQLLVHDWL